MTTTRTLFGFHAVTARLRQAPDSVRTLYVDAARNDSRARDLVARARSEGVDVHTVQASRLEALAGGASHQGVVAIVDPQRPYVTVDDVLSDLASPALLVVLDGVTDPHNLGACMRNADAFGAQAVIVPKDRAVGLTATAAKAASGAAETIPLIAVTNLARTLNELKKRGVWVFGADERGESLVDADLSGPLAWVLGAEGEGLRRLTRDTCDRLVRIPIVGSVASLNVSVATGICLYATLAARSRAIAAGTAVG